MVAAPAAPPVVHWSPQPEDFWSGDDEMEVEEEDEEVPANSAAGGY